MPGGFPIRIQLNIRFRGAGGGGGNMTQYGKYVTLHPFPKKEFKLIKVCGMYINVHR